jgi:hypothetical protein
MHKDAAVTALVIALNITMLTPAVGWLPPFDCDGVGNYRGPRYYCKWKCETELWYTAKLWDFTATIS